MYAQRVKFASMGKEKPKPDKPLAYQLYIGSDLKRYQIAQQAHCTEKTLRNWINDGNWEEIRNSQAITKPELIQTCYRQLAAVQKEVNDNHNGVPTKALSDAQSSIRKMIETLSDQPVHRYIEVLNDFTVWLSKSYPDKLKEQAVILNEYTQHIAQKIKQ